jgi:2-amino-4-hydroxy-6-hydroxymethyldihydropteridine diphosphokinase
VKFTETKHTCYLLLGSNLGNKTENIRFAIREIGLQAGELTKKSALYASEPWGFESEHDFVNAVIEIQTRLLPNELLKTVLEIEKNAGRKQPENAGYASRVLDIDILFYDDLVIEEDDLIIPHPRLHLRRFTLEPINEIAPGFLHPKIKKPVCELLKNCNDQLAVKKMKTQLSEI